MSVVELNIQINFFYFLSLFRSFSLPLAYIHLDMFNVSFDFETIIFHEYTIYIAHVKMHFITLSIRQTNVHGFSMIECVRLHRIRIVWNITIASFESIFKIPYTYSTYRILLFTSPSFVCCKNVQLTLIYNNIKTHLHKYITWLSPSLFRLISRLLRLCLN